MNGKERQVLETKKFLVRALLTLLQDKDYRAISIKEIIEVSQTSRRTFYRHFRNKDDLLDYYLQQLMEEYFDFERGKLPQYSCHEACLHFFSFWYSKRQELQGIIKSRLFSDFIYSWTAYAPLLVKTLFIECREEDVLLRMRFFIGGFCNTIWHWLEQEEPDSPERMTANFLKAFENGLW